MMVRVVAGRCQECGEEGKEIEWGHLRPLGHKPTEAIPVVAPVEAVRQFVELAMHRCGGRVLFATEPVAVEGQ